MMNLPQSTSKLEELFESGAPFDLEATIKSIAMAQDDASLSTTLKKNTDEKLEELVKLRFTTASDTANEKLCLTEIRNELATRFRLPPMRHNTYIKPAISAHFRNFFTEHLKQKITDDDDIQCKPFVDSFIAEYGQRFCLDKQTIHQFDLYPIAKGYFPSPDFHSRSARVERVEAAERYFKSDLRLLDLAKLDADAVLDKHNKGFETAGDIAADTWVEVMKRYFGTQFDIHQNVHIHVDDERLAEYDIVLTHKDRTHATPAITHYVNAKDVVAAFEVKKTLYRSHVALDNQDAIKIFDRDCIRLKKSVMPENRSLDRELTPYQMLRGKIYFGVLCLDVKDDAMQIMMSGESHPERHRLNRYMGEFGAMNELYSDYAPDIIFCKDQLLWAKETKVSPRRIFWQTTQFFTQKDTNSIDSSVSTFGYLIASMRRFFVGQGHIPRDLREDYLKPYQHFAFLNSDNRVGRWILLDISGNLPSPVREISQYLDTRIPNEHSNLPLPVRAPLRLLKHWTYDEAQDITAYVKRELKRIVKLELQINHQPLPIGVNPDDESFDAYINTLLSS